MSVDVYAEAGTTCPACGFEQPVTAGLVAPSPEQPLIRIRLDGGVKVAGVDLRLAVGVVASLLGKRAEAARFLNDVAADAGREHLTGVPRERHDAMVCACGHEWPVPYPLATPDAPRLVPSQAELGERRAALGSAAARLGALRARRDAPT